jgi:uncharacterized membrane protein
MSYYKYIYAFIYIIIDIFYILKSNTYYDKYVKNIQGFSMNNMKKNGIYMSAAIAYSILAIGWIYFIANKIEQNISYYNLFELCVIYSLCIYGVFNATLYAMFLNWNLNIAIRDTIWGLTSIIFLSMLYKYIYDNYILK